MFAKVAMVSLLMLVSARSRRVASKETMMWTCNNKILLIILRKKVRRLMVVLMMFAKRDVRSLLILALVNVMNVAVMGSILIINV